MGVAGEVRGEVGRGARGGAGAAHAACVLPRFVRGSAVFSRVRLMRLRAVPAHAHDVLVAAPALA